MTKKSPCGEKLLQPVMHGWYAGQCKRSLIQALVFATLGTTSMYLMYVRPRVNRQRKFNENYDAEKIFEEMRIKGVFDCCKKKCK